MKESEIKAAVSRAIGDSIAAAIIMWSQRITAGHLPTREESEDIYTAAVLTAFEKIAPFLKEPTEETP